MKDKEVKKPTKQKTTLAVHKRFQTAEGKKRQLTRQAKGEKTKAA